MAAATGWIDGVSRIAVLRANGIGDLVFALPALEALRRAYPHASVTLLGAPAHAELLRCRAGPVDEVLVVPRCRGVAEQEGAPTRDVEDFLAACRRRGFDLALQLHGGGAFSNPFVSALGARLTAGLRAPGAPPLDRWVRYVALQPEVLRYLEVVRLVGATPVGLAPRLTVSRSEQAAADGLRLLPGRRLVVLHPSAGDPRRRWPVDRFAAVGDVLARRHEADVVVTGSDADAGIVSRVVSAMSAPARSLAGATPLPLLLGLFAQADVVVSNDTGPAHLAAAVGAPTVAVYWWGNLVTGGPVEVGAHRAVTGTRLRCPVCDRENVDERCPHDVSFIADVPVASVLAEAEDLLTCRGPTDDAVNRR